jgi:hypothetical protein
MQRILPAAVVLAGLTLACLPTAAQQTDNNALHAVPLSPGN